MILPRGAHRLAAAFVVSLGLVCVTPAPALGLGGPAPAVDATFTCAPYDGRAIEVTFEVPGAWFVRAAIWGAGLIHMAAGSSAFALDGRQSSLGTGSATLCPTGSLAGGRTPPPCRLVTARFAFDVCGTRAGSRLQGRFYYRDAGGPEKVLPFAVAIRRPKGGGPYCP